MLAEIITIGDEILIGQIVDTNSAFISKELNKLGVQVYQITSVQDDRAHILQALNDAKNRVDLVTTSKKNPPLLIMPKPWFPPRPKFW